MKKIKEWAGFFAVMLFLTACGEEVSNLPVIQSSIVVQETDNLSDNATVSEEETEKMEREEERVKETPPLNDRYKGLEMVEVSYNALYDGTVSDGSVSVDTVSKDSISDDSISDDSVSEDSVSEDVLVDMSEQVRNIILDTDYASDVDDVAAVRVATSMHRMGMINLCALGTSCEGDYATRALHGQLCYDGLYEIPTGWYRDGVEDDSAFWDYFVWKYNDVQTYQLIDAVDLYKQTISANSLNGEKTRIVVLGFLVNIERLLMDEEGYQLVTDWVDSIWIDGGAYPMTGQDFNFFWKEECVRSIQYTIANSPVPLVFITNETGCDYNTNNCAYIGRNLSRLDPERNDPVSQAYYLGLGRVCGHFGWDGMTVWCAGTSSEQNMTHITPIDAYVYDNGVNEFILNPDGKDAILERDHNEIWWYNTEMEKLIDYGVRPY